MPFCSKCGNRVGDADSFCGRCGAGQPAGPGAVPPPPPPARPAQPPDPLGHINPRTAAILCYIPGLGWIAAIVVLASTRFRQDRGLRFHAFQGLYLFVAWLMADWVFKPMTLWMMPHAHFGSLIQVAVLVMSIFMIVKVAHNETYSLPLFGELAQRSIAEN